MGRKCCPPSRAGNRIFKASVAGDRKYIVDTVGQLPVILMELDADTKVIQKTYIYADSEVLAQYDVFHPAS